MKIKLCILIRARARFTIIDYYFYFIFPFFLSTSFSSFHQREPKSFILPFSNFFLDHGDLNKDVQSLCFTSKIQ
jgi:hypothetical protein